ncbi:MAG: ATP-binding cassette domain-containing protein [bacterium]|nr:ATP-binding cassette domain-containing protein [bacterium]
MTFIPHPVVSLKDVTLSYGTETIFRDANFSLEKGAFHYLTGPSGAGKTSLLRLMYMGNFDFSGTLQLFGQSVQVVSHEKRPLLRQKIGVVFQEFNLLDHLSAVDNVSLPLRIQGVGISESRQRAEEMLDWVGLGSYLDALPSTLSGGQKQRVVIARAVVGGPELLLADEPTGNLDDRNSVRLMALFESLHDAGTTIVFATHNSDLVMEFPYNQLHLEEGHIQLVQGQSRQSVSLHTEQVLQANVS